MSDKETKEALVGVNELSLELIKVFKKGVNLQSGLQLVIDLESNADLKAALEAAVSGVNAVPTELKSMELSDGLDLAMVQIQYIPKYLEALKS